MPEFVFPDGFLWGAATSSHQVEGNNSNNDWWAWEQAGRVKEASGIACDQYRRFRDDFDLAQLLGHNAHRFSIEWSRVEPREGEFSDEALRHYGDLVEALHQRGIAPIVTLHHYTNPLWLAAQGGWTNPKIVDRFARYTRRVAEALGDRVRYWLTINEPMVYAVMHYLDGIGPPGEQDLRLMFQVVEHLIRAHAASYRVIHEAAEARGWPAQVSLAKHAQPFEPCRGWWAVDRLIAWLTERTYNQGFLNALTQGVYQIPGRRPRRIPEAKGTLDFIGLNYYGRLFLRLTQVRQKQWWGVRCSTQHHPQVTERNDLEWDVYPPGILRILRWALPYRLPVLVTENGICTTDDGQRERFIVNHLRMVAHAMQAGVPVFGYLHWSLIDNFEWAHGYGPRFGLVEMDYATQQRRVRPSAHRFAQICRSNRIGLR
ncbi:MAG: glycoside hydrolase family 1 protein [Candidatus Omnitrophica bacterium]|nr:glycoside hydrolase family 1 protein [Candidatus Omnitrophota bacterium]